MDINRCKPYREGTHRQFVSRENRCTHIANNPNQKYVRQFRVDGEVFPADTEPMRCDYLLLNDTEKRSYYIELKGSDIVHAIDQIESTISLISPSIKEYKILCRIVYRTGTHAINRDKVLRWRRKRKEVVISSVQLEETL